MGQVCGASLRSSGKDSEWSMNTTFDSTSIEDANMRTYSYGVSTLTRSLSGEADGGVFGTLRCTLKNWGSLGSFTSLEVAFDLTPSSMSLTISELNGCGLGGKLLPEEMKKDMLLFLTILQEDLLESLERLSLESSYEKA